MSHSANLIGLLEAVHHQDSAQIHRAVKAYVAALESTSPPEAQACRQELEAWVQGNTRSHRPAPCLGRYLYHGQKAIAYDADGMEGLALHDGAGGMVFRVTTPPEAAFPQGEPSPRYVDARWCHDDLGLRVIAGTYAALYHLADGTWTIDHSPTAVPALVSPIQD